MKRFLTEDVGKKSFFYSKSDVMPIIKSNRLKACYAKINIW